MTPCVWRKGDRVRIELDGRSAVGVVELASSNGASLFLHFEGVLGGYVGAMPVLRDEEDGEFHDLITGCVVRLEAVS